MMCLHLFLMKLQLRLINCYRPDAQLQRDSLRTLYSCILLEFAELL